MWKLNKRSENKCNKIYVSVHEYFINKFDLYSFVYLSLCYPKRSWINVWWSFVVSTAWLQPSMAFDWEILEKFNTSTQNFNVETHFMLILNQKSCFIFKFNSKVVKFENCCQLLLLTETFESSWNSLKSLRSTALNSKNLLKRKKLELISQTFQFLIVTNV